jgi:hypothetical protein
LKATSQAVTFTLSEAGDCKWSLTDLAYDSMSGDCTGDGTTSQNCATAGLSEGAEIVYIACRDIVGNADTIATNEHVDYTISLFNPLTTITLSHGWNLTGASNENASFQPSAVFGGTEKEIMDYSNGTFNVLTNQATVNLAFGRGYWIYSGADLGKINVGGAVFGGSSRQFALSAGWNIFALPFDQPITWDDSHASLSCAGASTPLPPVYFFNAEIGVYIAVTPNSEAKIGPWAGYAIRVNVACTLTVNK